MNYKNKNRTLSDHRKVAVSFRDDCLLEVFETSLRMLNEIATKNVSLDGIPASGTKDAEDYLLNQVLNLITACLNFDFIGVLPDESSDDTNSLQVPNSWTDRIKSGNSLRLLFNIYKGCTTGKIPLIPDQPPPSIQAVKNSTKSVPTRPFNISSERAAQTLECISLLISVRRSLFATDKERRTFLSNVIRGVYDILREDQGLDHEDCYHRFCRLLSRIKSNYPLTDLINVEGYSEWLELTANFTIESCKNPSWSSNSMHYILGLWSKLVAGVPYANAQGATGLSGNVNSTALLANYVPQIINSYINGRVNSIFNDDQEGALDELNNIDQIQDQLEELPILCRYQYNEIGGMIQNIMDPILSKYSDIIDSATSNIDNSIKNSNVNVSLRLQECQLAWLVAIVGAIIGGGGSSSMTAGGQLGDEVMDAELIRRVMSLLAQTDDNVSVVTKDLSPEQCLHGINFQYLNLVRVDPRLELALLYFIDQFRNAFINDASGMPPPLSSTLNSSTSTSGLLLRPDPVVETQSNTGPTMNDSSMENSGTNLSNIGSAITAHFLASGGLTKLPQSYTELLETASGRQRTFLQMFKLMDLGEHTDVVETLIRKLANNLRYWGNRNDIIIKSLDVLHELVYSYSSGRLLLSLPSIDNFIMSHGPDNFPFLSQISNFRHRTGFYQSLARLIFFQDDNDRFEPFIEPLLAILDDIRVELDNNSNGNRRPSNEVMHSLIGSARDFRGILAAAHSSAAYVQCFEALYPTYLETFIKGLEIWSNEPMVTTAILKLFAELVSQRGQRIQFGSNSPNGVLLFKITSQAIFTYGSRIMETDVSNAGSRIYNNRYKGIAICSQIFSRCMDGSFVNFGIFELYGDNTFDQALDIVLKMLLSIPLNDILEHPKVVSQFMAVIHGICRSHINELIKLTDDEFLLIIQSISEGIDSLSMTIADQAARSLDYLATAYVRNYKKNTPLGNGLREKIMIASESSGDEGIFSMLMKILFQILMFSENGNKYSLAKPVLPVILAAELTQQNVLENFKNELVQSQPQIHKDRMRKEFNSLAKDITRNLDPINRDKFVQRLAAFSGSVREFAIM